MTDLAPPNSPQSHDAATICETCKATLPAAAVYHEAVRYYERHGWPEAKGHQHA